MTITIHEHDHDVFDRYIVDERTAMAVRITSVVLLLLLFLPAHAQAQPNLKKAYIFGAWHSY